MILDKLSNAKKYYALSSDIEVALRYLESEADMLKTSNDFSVINLNDTVQTKIIQYDTFPHDRRWESHHTHIDIQFMVNGSERIGFAPVDIMHAPVKSEGKDQTIWQGDGDRILLPEGFFIILFPGEAHMSKLADGHVSTVRKAAFKIKCSEE